MIGAMPAVAVRHERRRQEKKIKYPSQLHFHEQWPQHSQSPVISMTSIRNAQIDLLPEVYLCGKVSGLHAIIVCFLLGTVLSVIGLLQLSPGSTSENKVVLFVCSSLLFSLGILLSIFRCYLLQCTSNATESFNSSLSQTSGNLKRTQNPPLESTTEL